MGDAGIPSNASGTITSDVTPNTLIDRTIAFVRTQLSAWRDDPVRPHEEAEDKLTAQLCKFLQREARRSFPSILFSREEPQRASTTVDLAVSSEQISGGIYLSSIYEPFLVLECKRLPAPTASREREYVTGREIESGVIKRSGGIQRFKLRLHGHEHETAVMIGYVQGGTLASWLTTINGWVSDLVGKTTADGCAWEASEQLSDYQEDTIRGTSICFSRHARIGDPPGDVIRLNHLWVLMIVK